MVVVWTLSSEKRLDEIYRFYEEKSKQVAKNLVADLRQAAKSLAEFPYMAAIEPGLTEFSETFRSFVVRDIFKIVYYVDSDIIYIVSIWDCRQDPRKMKDFVR